MSLGDSIKARLRNRAISENRTFQEVLTIYGLERALYRLSISKYRNQFVLKGGILLYALYQGDFIRGTSDVDLLGQRVSNNLEVIKKTFTDIFGIEYHEDGIIYDIDSLQAKRTSELKSNPGIRITIDGYLDRTNVSVHIDLGFGDSIYPSSVSMEYPTLLNQPAPMIKTYSKESVIAEKFQAIVSLGKVNSRMKDFYDIYALMHSFDFDRRTLREAIKETFGNRKTSFDVIVAFDRDFSMDPYRRRMWKSFLGSKNISLSIEFEKVMTEIKNFLGPLLNAMENQTDQSGKWDHRTLSWEDIQNG